MRPANKHYTVFGHSESLTVIHRPDSASTICAEKAGQDSDTPVRWTKVRLSLVAPENPTDGSHILARKPSSWMITNMTPTPQG